MIASLDPSSYVRAAEEPEAVGYPPPVNTSARYVHNRPGLGAQLVDKRIDPRVRQSA
jgi:hypothetical protein